MGEDYMTPMAQNAAQIHEVYEAFKAAGFTEKQALEIILTMVSVYSSQQ